MSKLIKGLGVALGVSTVAGLTIYCINKVRKVNNFEDFDTPLFEGKDDSSYCPFCHNNGCDHKCGKVDNEISEESWENNSESFNIPSDDVDWGSTSDFDEHTNTESDSESTWDLAEDIDECNNTSSDFFTDEDLNGIPNSKVQANIDPFELLYGVSKDYVISCLVNSNFTRESVDNLSDEDLFNAYKELIKD